jgi:hypothetical protein
MTRHPNPEGFVVEITAGWQSRGAINIASPARQNRFRIGDKDRKREDDLLDMFCYGIALALGNNEGF